MREVFDRLNSEGAPEEFFDPEIDVTNFREIARPGSLRGLRRAAPLA